jgi:DNA-directed RNA polymerase alpha subunit
MPNTPFPVPPLDIAILIEKAHDARVAAHIGAVLARLKSRGTTSSDRKVEQLDKGLFEICGGPIQGLRLPLNAWNVLHREGITTLDQLRAKADQIERFSGIGAKTALAIRVELGRVALLEAQSR